ncbi:FAD dependent oxidoreductase [Xylaria sp. CBS 124048]|nr:FAD dependent oxidoreductase [Xylaria sp. CBS 124048]
MPNIVVVGAGVSGLTCAYLLSKQKDNVITIIAKHMPGDYDIEYASPFAGANVLPMSTEKDSSQENRTWKELKRLAEEVPEAGIHLQKSRVFRREKDIEHLRKGSYKFDGLFREDPWFRSLFDDYRELSKEELPEGMTSGCEFTSVCINVMLYLPWLVGQCRKNGVVLRRGRLQHIAEASHMSHAGGKADVVINATGIMASRLGGVMDQNVIPVRGQVVVVRNEAPYMATTSGTDDAEDEICYAMTRASGGGTVLGGTYTKGQWESQPDLNIATRIMSRVSELVPEMTNGQGVKGFDIIRHAVGLRPYRDGGVRIDKEKIGDTWVVHNYGHAGWGYQGSYGCAEDVVRLVGEVLNESKL